MSEQKPTRSAHPAPALDTGALSQLLKDMEADSKHRVEGAPILGYLIRLTKLLQGAGEAS